MYKKNTLLIFTILLLTCLASTYAENINNNERLVNNKIGENIQKIEQAAEEFQNAAREAVKNIEEEHERQQVDSPQKQDYIQSFANNYLWGMVERFQKYLNQNDEFSGQGQGGVIGNNIGDSTGAQNTQVQTIQGLSGSNTGGGVAPATSDGTTPTKDPSYTIFSSKTNGAGGDQGYVGNTIVTAQNTLAQSIGDFGGARSSASSIAKSIGLSVTGLTIGQGITGGDNTGTIAGTGVSTDNTVAKTIGAFLGGAHGGSSSSANSIGQVIASGAQSVGQVITGSGNSIAKTIAGSSGQTFAQSIAATDSISQSIAHFIATGFQVIAGNVDLKDGEYVDRSYGFIPKSSADQKEIEKRQNQVHKQMRDQSPATYDKLTQDELNLIDEDIARDAIRDIQQQREIEYNKQLENIQNNEPNAYAKQNKQQAQVEDAYAAYEDNEKELQELYALLPGQVYQEEILKSNKVQQVEMTQDQIEAEAIEQYNQLQQEEAIAEQNHAEFLKEIENLPEEVYQEEIQQSNNNANDLNNNQNEINKMVQNEDNTLEEQIDLLQQDNQIAQQIENEFMQELVNLPEQVYQEEHPNKMVQHELTPEEIEQEALEQYEELQQENQIADQIENEFMQELVNLPEQLYQEEHPNKMVQHELTPEEIEQEALEQYEALQQDNQIAQQIENEFMQELVNLPEEVYQEEHPNKIVQHEFDQNEIEQEALEQYEALQQENQVADQIQQQFQQELENLPEQVYLELHPNKMVQQEMQQNEEQELMDQLEQLQEEEQLQKDAHDEIEQLRDDLYTQQSPAIVQKQITQQDQEQEVMNQMDMLNRYNNGEKIEQYNQENMNKFVENENQKELEEVEQQIQNQYTLLQQLIQNNEQHQLNELNENQNDQENENLDKQIRDQLDIIQNYHKQQQVKKEQQQQQQQKQN